MAIICNLIVVSDGSGVWSSTEPESFNMWNVAGYYSYKFAEVLSADAFAAFEESGLEDEARVAETGRRFRDTVLALGGGRAPDLVFRVWQGWSTLYYQG